MFIQLNNGELFRVNCEAQPNVGILKNGVRHSLCLQEVFAIILEFSDNSSTDIILTNNSLHVEVLTSIVEAPARNVSHGF